MHIRGLTDDPSRVKRILESLDIYDDLMEDQALARSPPHSKGSDLSLDLTESQIPLDELYLN